MLRAIWVAAEDASQRSVTALALVHTAIATARATVASRKRGLIHSDFVAPRPRQHLEFGGALPPARHPSWPKPKSAVKPLDHDPNARAKAEQDLRTKWLVELRGHIVSAGLPIVTLMQGSVSADVLLASAGQGRRARTIRRRVLDFRHISSFMLQSWGRLFPTGVGMFIDFLKVLSGGGASKSKLERAIFALGFVEAAGAVLFTDRMSMHSLVLGVLNEWKCVEAHVIHAACCSKFSVFE